MAARPGLDVDIEERAVEALPPAARRRWTQIDSAMAGFMESHGTTLLRLAVGLVFLWFGALKLIGRSPVADLVADTVYWLPSAFFVRLLGVWEMVVAIGLLIPVALRATLLLFWAQLAGTFLVLFTRPERSFQRNNPLLLTMTGEFVVKNLVLITAGLVIGSTVRKRRRAT